MICSTCRGSRAARSSSSSRLSTSRRSSPQRSRPAGLPATSGPAAAAQASARPTANTEAPPSPAGLRVLVVDDNRDVADSTASVMRMNGCDVHVAYDGKAALESVQRLRPDAVLLDIGL